MSRSSAESIRSVIDGTKGTHACWQGPENSLFGTGEAGDEDFSQQHVLLFRVIEIRLHGQRFASTASSSCLYFLISGRVVQSFL